uniref:Uncharacterized protein n=1 Tax=Arundo donax TaxID=35708 RepID=A0A0A9FG67_ARUDO
MFFPAFSLSFRFFTLGYYSSETLLSFLSVYGMMDENLIVGLALKFVVDIPRYICFPIRL